MTLHQQSYSREYQAWHRMRTSCQNPNYAGYKKYGAKGVTICKEWETFSRFSADMGPMPETCNGLALLGDAKEFRKENCEWQKKVTGRPTTIGKARCQFKSVALTMDANLYDQIQKRALDIACDGDKPMNVPTIIRKILEREFPYMQQQDIFKNE